MDQLNCCTGSKCLALALSLMVATGVRAQLNRPTPSDRSAEPGGELVLDNCKVAFISEPILAFQEAGIVRLVPEEGQRINRGDVLSQLDDQDVQLQVDVAKYSYDAARLEAENDIRVRYAIANAEASKADLDSGRDANRRKAGVVTQMELRRRQLEYDANLLSIENARHEIDVAGATAKVKAAELKTAEAMLNRMQLRSPITGIVTKKLRYVGEYARAGDPVVQVGQLDRLRVQGRADFNELPITAARGCDVEIHVCGEVFRSRIDYVDARVDDGKYVVWAEIDNRVGPQGEFLVRPGMTAEMQVQKGPSVARLRP